MKKKRIIQEVLVGELLLIGIDLLCYEDILWMLPLQLLLIPYLSVLKKKNEQNRSRLYEQGFKELLQSLMTSLQAGYSIENSCRVALSELENLYHSKTHPMVVQLGKIVYGIELNIPVEKLFMNFASETRIDDIYQFAVVLDIAKNTGGNIVEILKNAMEHMQIKMDANEEIAVLLSGKIFEKNIMLFMPFGILFYLKVTNPTYITCFYQTIIGHLLMTGVIAIVLFCFFWTERIVNHSSLR